MQCTISLYVTGSHINIAKGLREDETLTIMGLNDREEIRHVSHLSNVFC